MLLKSQQAPDDDRKLTAQLQANYKRIMWISSFKLKQERFSCRWTADWWHKPERRRFYFHQWRFFIPSNDLTWKKCVVTESVVEFYIEILFRYWKVLIGCLPTTLRSQVALPRIQCAAFATKVCNRYSDSSLYNKTSTNALLMTYIYIYVILAVPSFTCKWSSYKQMIKYWYVDLQVTVSNLWRLVFWEGPRNQRGTPSQLHIFLTFQLLVFFLFWIKIHYPTDC